MLKIKDNVDLKELEKFGFRARYNEDTGKITEMYRITGRGKGTTITMDENFAQDKPYKNFWRIFSWNRKITNNGYISLTDNDYEILYDLIQAGLVEKV